MSWFMDACLGMNQAPLCDELVKMQIDNLQLRWFRIRVVSEPEDPWCAIFARDLRRFK